MTHYRFEHDPHLSINLDTPVEFLKQHQARLHKIAAAIAKDIDKLTDIIVRKQDE